LKTGLTFIAGKQPPPSYTTGLVFVIYDTYIGLQGLVERIDSHKFFNMAFAKPVAAEGNAPPPAPPRPGNSLELVGISSIDPNLNSSNYRLYVGRSLISSLEHYLTSIFFHASALQQDSQRRFRKSVRASLEGLLSSLQLVLERPET
jgi:hypothetical protein